MLRLLLGVALLAFLCSSDLTAGQEYPYVRQALTLSGPDDEGMLTCTMPYSFQLDTEVEWFGNNKLLKSVFMARDRLHDYQSIQDLADLIGDYPNTIQCVVTDTEISVFYMTSNTIIAVS